MRYAAYEEREIFEHERGFSGRRLFMRVCARSAGGLRDIIRERDAPPPASRVMPRARVCAQKEEKREAKTWLPCRVMRDMARHILFFICCARLSAARERHVIFNMRMPFMASLMPRARRSFERGRELEMTRSIEKEMLRESAEQQKSFC